MVISQFDNITGGTTGLAFDLYGVPESMLMYLSALPIFMTEIGVVKDGDNLSYENMQESLKREILQLKAAFTTNTRTERIELVVSGSKVRTTTGPPVLAAKSPAWARSC